MRAFIVRPFSKRGEIDFNLVQQKLIDPALEQTRIAGDTTQQFVEAGNIRVDMFEQLLLADLVIADISVHNANVFYELGIRHALRARQTILIRAKVTKPRADRSAEDEVPFDLRTDRYLEYDHTKPEAALGDLVKALQDTTYGQRVDSPVFLSLPLLAEQERSRFSPVPRTFAEEVEQASAAKDIPYLGLLAVEASGFTWELEGWRKVGKKLFDLGAWPTAARTLERIRVVDPGDLLANLWLGTVYQRLERFSESDQALQRVLDNPAASRRHLSEAWALRGSNEKVKWVGSWSNVEPAARTETALRSPFLLASFRSYEKAFSQDLNSFYPGLVALSLLTIRRDLIAKHPEIWGEEFETEAEQTVARAKLERDLSALAGAVRLALEADMSSEWYPIGWADYQFLVAEKPSVAVAAYRRALGDQPLFHSASARRQLQIFADLDVKGDRIAACLAMFAPIGQKPSAPAHVILFTGHRVDEPGRTPPRFPEACVPAARSEISSRLTRLAPTFGIAAAASGGDLLFHEACGALGVTSEVCLVMPPQSFVNESVVSSGADWVERYWTLVNAKRKDTRLVQLSARDELPDWLKRKREYAIWNRANLWMLERALAMAPERLTVMALWDGKAQGDGPGGTSDLLAKGKEVDATREVIDTGSLCAGD